MADLPCPRFVSQVSQSQLRPVPKCLPILAGRLRKYGEAGPKAPRGTAPGPNALVLSHVSQTIYHLPKTLPI